ncbi:MAG: hypothetical protein Fur009_1280 [Candidatus Microgenomates bacterium]
MLYLIISDLHLKYFDLNNKINYLKNLFSSFENIIIVGDLFEGYYWSFQETVKKFYFLFEILKSKNSIYLLGNHDEIVEKDIDLAKIFFKFVGYEYFLKLDNNKKILLFHSHKIFPAIDSYLKTRYLPKYITSFFLNLIGYYKKHKQRAEFYLNNKNVLIENDTKKLLKKIDKKFPNRDFWIITGHTHNPVILKEKKYANCGFVDFGFSSYIVINDKGDIKLYCENY